MRRESVLETHLLPCPELSRRTLQVDALATHEQHSSQQLADVVESELEQHDQERSKRSLVNKLERIGWGAGFGHEASQFWGAGSLKTDRVGGQSCLMSQRTDLVARIVKVSGYHPSSGSGSR